MRKGLCLRCADAEEELTELDRSRAYIIGGIVDRNRHKGLCRSRAEAGGIRTARLPIRDYLRLQAAPVMTVNQVNIHSFLSADVNSILNSVQSQPRSGVPEALYV